ncbi:MAG: hypothetical protein U9P38_03025 [Campylobacterota bacterium]|nr:hypothetical protein [Campylobacterota bacterium]
MKTIISIIFILTIDLLGDTAPYDEEKIVLEKNTYKTIEFDKRVVNIRLSDSKKLGIDYISSKKLAFSKIRVFAKKTGTINALIHFWDKSVKQIHFTITEDIRDIKSIINYIAKDIEVALINDTVILKGRVKNSKTEEKILLLLKESTPTKKIVNLLDIEEPDKMVRLKLYVAEINNKEGEIIKNNWNLAFNSDSSSASISSSMLNSVTLSGGITAVANNLGKKFDTALTLNYLKTNNVAKILDETTLITLENEDAEFLAGGTLLIETASTSAEGQPISSITTIDYGLKLKITIKDILNNRYINLEIDTSSSALDKTNGVGNIPAKTDKSIKTNVVVANNATIVLGGLINNSNSKDFEQIPLLGDIPIIGKVFQSKAFLDGESELIFFITPTIVNAKSNNQQDEYDDRVENIINKD